jgi:hypothetical protein
MKALPEYDKLLLTPIPRYLWSSCCEDPTHAPNVAADEHLVTMLADLEATSRRGYRAVWTFWRSRLPSDLYMVR